MERTLRVTLSITLGLLCLALTSVKGHGLPEILLRALQADEGIIAKYDVAKNETAVVIFPYIGVDRRGSGYDTDVIAMTAGFTYAGRTLTATPQSVELGLLSYTRHKWRFEQERDRNLLIIVDNERIPSGNLNRVKGVPSNGSYHSYYQEQLAIFIPYETFVKMANGKKVVIQAGVYEIKLEKKHLELFRKLVSRMKP